MKTYLVGGAVRDELLGLAVTERDYVVVGATPEDMIAAGYTQVGRDFPVFLHPDTHEEHALARTERKTGPGHRGFEVHTSPGVTLEEDLVRRDLTINAIAMDSDGSLIDPCGGRHDIEARLLRHVSAAFTEDPLRILRIARFLAKLHLLGFEVASETLTLLRHMVARNMLDELSPDRIVAELDKVLTTPEPACFFELLEDIGAGKVLWPELKSSDIDRLKDNDPKDPEARFCQLVIAMTPEVIDALCRRLRCSNLRRELAVLGSRMAEDWSRFKEFDASQIASCIERADGVRKRDRFETFASIADAILKTDTSAGWLQAQQIMASVKAADIPGDIKGPALGELIRKEQIARLSDAFGRAG